MVETNINIANVQGEQGIDADSVTSKDQSITITETDNGIDLSVPLVTEEQNGLERKEDKYLRDHSLTNIAHIGGAFATAANAADALCEIDAQYEPMYGQMIQYSDLKNDLHLARFNGSGLIERKNKRGRRWADVAFDEAHNRWCLMESTAGSRFVIAYSAFSAANWTIKEPGISSERWLTIAAGGGYIFAVSGNQTQECALSSDGGETWVLKTSPTKMSPSKVIWGNLWTGGNGFLISSGYPGSDGAFDKIMEYNPFTDKWGEHETSNFYTVNNLMVQDLVQSDRLGRLYTITKKDSEFRLYTTTSEGTPKRYAIVCDLDAQYNICQLVSSGSIDHIILRRDGQIKVIRYDTAEGTEEGTKAGMIIDEQNIIEDNICSMFYTSDMSVKVLCYHNKVTLNDKEVELPISSANWKVFKLQGDHLLMTTGTHPYATSTGNEALLINVRTGEVENYGWDELPILSSNSNTLLGVKDNEFVNVDTADYIGYTDGEIATIHSDRCAHYAAYRLTAPSGDFFVEKELKQLAIGDKVFADESLATEYGTITNVHHNINNPLDVVIESTDGTTTTTDFVGKQVSALATVNAVVALGELKRDKPAGELMKEGEDAAEENFAILYSFMKEGREIDLCGKTFFLKNSKQWNIVDKPITIRNGGLTYLSSFIFDVREGFSLTLENLKITNLTDSFFEMFTPNYYIDAPAYPIDHIIIRGCEVTDMGIIVRITWTTDDIPLSNRRIGTLLVENNLLRAENHNGNWVALAHCQADKLCRFSGNRCEGTITVAFSFASDIYNEASADVEVLDNYFDCGFTDRTLQKGSYHCSVLVEQRKLIFRGNHIERCITRDGNSHDITAYVEQLYYEDNVVRDIACIPATTTDAILQNIAYCKVLPSGYAEYYGGDTATNTDFYGRTRVVVSGNVFELDYDRVLALGYGTPQKAVDMLFQIGPRDTTIVRHNTIRLLGGFYLKTWVCSRELRYEYNDITSAALEQASQGKAYDTYPVVQIRNTSFDTPTNICERAEMHHNTLTAWTGGDAKNGISLIETNARQPKNTILTHNTITGGSGSAGAPGFDVNNKSERRTSWVERGNTHVLPARGARVFEFTHVSEHLDKEFTLANDLCTSRPVFFPSPLSTDYHLRINLSHELMLRTDYSGIIQFICKDMIAEVAVFLIRVRNTYLGETLTHQMYMKYDRVNQQTFASPDGATWTEHTSASYYYRVANKATLRMGWTSGTCMVYVDKLKMDPGTDCVLDLYTVEVTMPKIPLTVTINGNATTASYDGLEHTASGYTLSYNDTEGDFNDSDITFNGTADDITASTTDIGTEEKQIDTSLFENTNSKYEVTFVAGTPISATVEKAKVNVTIKGAITTAEYDGEEHTASGYEFISDNSNYAQQELDFYGEATAKGTEPGKYNMGLSADNFKNVNRSVDVALTIEDGYVEITKKKAIVTITGNTTTAAYDGATHYANGYAISINIPDIAGAWITYSGTARAERTAIGKTLMGLSKEKFACTNANYDVEFVIESDGYVEITE